MEEFGHDLVDLDFSGELACSTKEGLSIGSFDSTKKFSSSSCSKMIGEVGLITFLDRR
jgi:hypothetical protein